MDMVMQLQSPSRHSQMNYYLSTPRQAPPQRFESSAAMAAAVMNARSSAFAKRSLIFKPAPVAASIVSDWGSKWEGLQEAAFGLNGAAVRDEFKMPLWAEKMYIEHEKQQRVA
ncbi:hypothetical protein HID58_059072 [Brassica napus]|uniref:Uncharacterized protein n=1 Tax=Brassica napus TaxID=3708 RepID=A0ABQ7ZRU6_BRANA|nr:hypothetical protein HID58_059072 [Brassica napus]